MTNNSKNRVQKIYQHPKIIFIKKNKMKVRKKLVDGEKITSKKEERKQLTIKREKPSHKVIKEKNHHITTYFH